MSFWIHAYCNESDPVTPQELAGGIAERLALLTYLFCPAEEEEPSDVLARLKIEDKSTDGTFRVFLIFYRTDTPVFIRIDRHDGRGAIDELDQEVLSVRPEPEVVKIRKMLAEAKEDVTFCLKAHDVDAMGFPLAIAAASYLVQKAGGLIQSGSYSWMVPIGKEVRIVAEIEV